MLGLIPGHLSAQSTQSKEMKRGTEIARNEIVGRRAEERQIKVYSKHPLIKAQFDSYSRELRLQMRQMLDLTRVDEWSVRHEIFLYGTGNDVHSGNDIITSAEINAADQFTLQIKVRIHDRFKEESFRLALIKMFLIEQMLEAFMENPKTFTTKSLEPPDWMIHGFDHNLRHKQLGRPSYFYSGFFKTGQLMKVEELMEPHKARGLNAISLEIFRASSAVLVGALCDQKDGGESVRAMLKDLALRPDYEPDSLIRKHFPGFRETGQGIDKWWALQLATMAQQQSFEYFTAEQTEKHLEDAIAVSFAEVSTPSASAQKANPSLFDKLKGKVGNAKKTGEEDKPAFKGNLEQYRQFLDRKNANEVILHRQSSLFALKIKAFPLYHDVIDRYAAICSQLIERDLDKIDAEFAELRKMREQIRKSLQHTKDYLNYYEATRSPKRSDAFDSYLKFKESMTRRALPPRTDSISTYLDRIEAERPFFGD